MIRRLSVLLIVLLLSGKTGNARQRGFTRAKDYFSVFRYEPYFNKLVVPVTIHGKSYRFILDTGAPNTISRELYEALKPEVIDKVQVIDQSGKTDSLNIVSVKELWLGNVLFEGIPTLVAKDGSVFDCFEVDGLIGSNMLADAIVRFSSRDSSITLTDAISRLALNKKQSSRLRLSPGQSNPYIEVTLKNQKTVKEVLLFDTGADTFYDMAISSFNQFRPYAIFSRVEDGYGSNTVGLHGVADSSLVYRVKTPVIMINGVTFRNATAQTTDNSHSRIGRDLLDHGIVTVDYRHKKFYFEAFKEDNDLLEKLPGFNPSFINNQYAVGIIWSAQLRKSISTGDQIISIDGTNYEQITLCELLQKETAFKHKDKVAIVLKDKNGEIHTLHLAKE